MNMVCLDGNLVADPELKSVASEEFSVCNFTIAVSDKAAKKEHTSYIDIVSWGKLAENMAQYEKKGDRVLVTGFLKQDRWQTKESQSRSKLRVVASRVDFLPRGGFSEKQRRPEGEKVALKHEERQNDEYVGGNEEDEMPF